MSKHRKLKQAPRVGAGRPKVIPVGARTRSLRVTDDEYRRVKEFLQEIRATQSQNKNV